MRGAPDQLNLLQKVLILVSQQIAGRGRVNAIDHILLG